MNVMEEKIAHAVVMNALESVMITDPNGIIQSVNPAFTQITGYEMNEVLGRTPKLLKSEYHDATFYKQMWDTISTQGYWQGEVWNRKKNGDTYPEWKTIFSIVDEHGAIQYYVSIASDLSTLKDKERLINRLSYFDPLTDLPNQALFRDRGEIALGQAQQKQENLAIIVLSINRFKKITEFLGKRVGDEILKQVANRIKQWLPDGDTVARRGGDEFKFLLSNPNDDQKVIGWSRQILQLFEEPFYVQNQQLYLSASIGISLFPRDGRDLDTLHQQAETALNRAKSNGTPFEFFNPRMDDHSISFIELETQLRIALEKEEFELYYQPQFELLSGHLSGVEALIRWNHPTLGRVSPGQFIPLAEETGLIHPLGEWILKRACQQIGEWQRELGNPIKLSVNLSAIQFKDKKMIQTLSQILNETSFPPAELELEITESMAMDPQNTVHILEEFKKLGVNVSIDDFGTGYSSLSYLPHLPIDTLKIDQSFIKNMVEDKGNRSIVSTIISMAHSLDLNVIAEGVENEDQLRILRSFSCDQAQGFYFSAAVPFESLCEYVKPVR